MSEILLSQVEADYLMALEKVQVEYREYDYPDLGGRLCIPLISTDKKENFHLDISRGCIDIRRGKYQARSRQVIILARLDFSSPHRNPDESEIGVPHLHLYREGYGDKWAYPVPGEVFRDTEDRWQTLVDFMNYCNITDQPVIRSGLFT